MFNLQGKKIKRSSDSEVKQDDEGKATEASVGKDNANKDHEAMWAELANLGGIAEYQVLTLSEQPGVKMTWCSRSVLIHIKFCHFLEMNSNTRRYFGSLIIH